MQNILIVKYNVGTPDSVRWDSDDRNAHILLRVPSEFHVSPFLWGEGWFGHTHTHTHLRLNIHLLAVVKI